VIRAVVVDIEGTTSSLDHVRTVLFPYSRARIGAWLSRPEPAVLRILDDVRRQTGRPTASVDEIAELLRGWIDADVKAVPLKNLQGLIWAHGYACGELTAHVYDDVPQALRNWVATGRPVYVYSSGSVLAQRSWFQHTQHGDLRPYLSGYFDIPAVGAKQDADSYRAIARALDLGAADIAFLSDIRAELDASRYAGIWPVYVRRGHTLPRLPDHVTITTFDQLDLSGDKPRLRQEVADAR
jgi:enolase-phosphatase E1